MSFVIRAREVEYSKLSEKFNSFSVVGSRCVDYVIKASKTDTNLIVFYLGHPLISVFVVSYSFISRGIILLWAAIHHIFLMRCWTKIFVSIVKMISVYMVWVHTFGAWAYNLMHRKQSSACSADGNKPIARFTRAPIKRRQGVISVCADNSVNTFCEGNKFDRLIERLDNSVSRHVAFHKEPPFLVRLSAAHFNFHNYIMLEAN